MATIRDPRSAMSIERDQKAWICRMCTVLSFACSHVMRLHTGAESHATHGNVCSGGLMEVGGAGNTPPSIVVGVHAYANREICRAKPAK